MNELERRAFNNLAKRRAALREEYDRLIAEPASFGITGSVNATNQKLAELRTEISIVTHQMAHIMGASGPSGMSFCYPNYRR